MAGKTGLGKGLDALFSGGLQNIAEEEKLQAGESIVNLKLIEVEPNKEQPRMRFDDEKIEAFDDMLYFCEKIKNVELKDLLDDIDKHIEDSI